MSSMKLVSMLINSCLHYCRIDLFEDKNEGHLPRSTRDVVVKDFKSIFGEQDIVNGMVMPSAEAIAGIQPEFLRKSMFVSCWFMKEYEDAVHWSTYARGGFAIKSTYSLMCKSMSLSDELDGFYSGMVSYIDHDTFNDSDFLEAYRRGTQPYSVAFMKDRVFDSEREVRFVIVKEPKSPGTKIVSPETYMRQSKVLMLQGPIQKYVQEIVASPWTPSWEVQTIKNLCEGLGHKEITISRSKIVFK